MKVTLRAGSAMDSWKPSSEKKPGGRKEQRSMCELPGFGSKNASVLSERGPPANGEKLATQRMLRARILRPLRAHISRKCNGF